MKRRWSRIPPAVRDGIRDLALRGFHSFWQGAGVLLVPGVLAAVRAQDLASLPWAGAAVTGGVAALASVITSALSWKVPPLPFWADTLIRGVKTSGAVFLGALTATGVDALHFPWGASVSAAVLAGVTAVVRAFVSAADKGGTATYDAVVSAARLNASGAWPSTPSPAAIGNGTTVTDDNPHGEYDPRHDAAD